MARLVAGGEEAGPQPTAPPSPVSLAQNAGPVLISAALFVGFVGYFGALCLRPRWGGDLQMYWAGIARLYADFFHPLHEALPLPGSLSTVYTPYLVAVAGAGRLLGLSPFRALQCAGVFNLVLLVVSSCFLFSRCSIHRRWSLPAACFLLSWLLVQWRHFGWSSALGLTTLQYIQPYPSTFAWCLAFFAFGLMDGALRCRYRDLALLCGLLAALLLIHGLTASWVFGIFGLLGLWRAWTQRSVRPLVTTLAVLTTAGLIALPWPYSPLLGQQSLMAVKEGAPFGGLPSDEFPNLYALGVTALAFIGWHLRRHGFWAAGLLATLAALGVWNAIGFDFGRRYAIFATFFLHFAIAEMMAIALFGLLGLPTGLEPAQRSPRLARALPLGLTVVALTSWLASPMATIAAQGGDAIGALPSFRTLRGRVPQAQIHGKDFVALKSFLTPADVVLIPPSRAVFDFAGATGASVVAAPNALRVPDYVERLRHVQHFFKPTTSAAQRRAIARRYGATGVYVPRAYLGGLPGLQRLFGKPTYVDERGALLLTGARR